MRISSTFIAFTFATTTLAVPQYVQPPANPEFNMDCAGSDGGDASRVLTCPDKEVYDSVSQWGQCGCMISNFCCRRGAWGDYRAEDVINEYKDGGCSCDG